MPVTQHGDDVLVDLAGQIPVELPGNDRDGLARRGVAGRGEAVDRGRGGQQQGGGFQGLRLQEVPLREGRAHAVRGTYVRRYLCLVHVWLFYCCRCICIRQPALTFPHRLRYVTDASSVSAFSCMKLFFNFQLSRSHRQGYLVRSLFAPLVHVGISYHLVSGREFLFGFVFLLRLSYLDRLFRIGLLIDFFRALKSKYEAEQKEMARLQGFVDRFGAQVHTTPTRIKLPDEGLNVVTTMLLCIRNGCS